MTVKEARQLMEQYIAADDIYLQHKTVDGLILSDWDMFCIQHCESMETLLNDHTRIKKLNQDLICVYRQIYKYLFEKGQDELGMYLANSIGDVGGIEDFGITEEDTTDYYDEYYKLKRECNKMKKELEELKNEKNKIG